MGRLTLAQRMRVVNIWQERDPPLGMNKISRLLALEHIVISKTGISNIIKKYNRYKTVSDIKAPPRQRQNVTHEVLDFIDSQMELNDELTGRDLQKNIERHFRFNFSIQKVKILRKKLGWLGEKSRYCQLVREVNREKRLIFAQQCIQSKDQFDNVIWSDECNVQLDWNGSITFHRWWEPCPQKGKPKHPFKVSVWAGISKRGASQILVFTGIMEKVYYSNSIIKDTLSPFIKVAFPDGHRFMQDNDPKHTSNLGKETLNVMELIGGKP